MPARAPRAACVEIPRSAIFLVREDEAHERHDSRRETNQKHCVLERQYSNRSHCLCRQDGGREVVEGFTIFFFGCYFHTRLLAKYGPTAENVVDVK